MIGLERAVRVRRHEHQRLDDLAELRADGRRGLLGRVGGLARTRGPRASTPLRAAASTTRWIGAGLRVSGTAGSTTGRRAVRSGTMPPQIGARAPRARHVLVVADGDVPPRAALDAAWPGWARRRRGGDRGGRRAARALARSASSPTLLVGDLDSLDPAAGRGGRGSRHRGSVRSPVDKDESDTELALLEAVRRGATRVTVLGAFGGPRLDHALANVWLLAHPALEGVEVALLDARTRASLISAPGPDGAPVERPLPGRLGAHGLAAAARRRRDGHHDRAGSATRSTTSRSASARRAACPTSARRRTPPCTLRDGRLLVDRDRAVTARAGLSSAP